MMNKIITVSINAFDKGTREEKARKVCEEAMEFYAQHVLDKTYNAFDLDNEGDHLYSFMLEIGDVVTALVNYCASVGIDLQECIDLTETKNIVRGYYDTMDS